MILHRGEIYFISSSNNTNTVGSEYGGDRPAIIVSNDIGNKHSKCVEIVYLTTKPKKPMPTHVPVVGNYPSTALCEQIYTVSIDRIKEYIRKCSDEEMEQIDKALMCSLGIEETNVENKGTIPAKQVGQAFELLKIEHERDMYKSLYENLLDKITG